MGASAKPPSPIAPRARATFVHAATIVAAAVVVHHGALALFFSQDDFAGLARATGSLPRLAGPWRIISQQWFWDVLRPLAGLDPRPYHVASLAAHATGAVLLLLWLRRRVSETAALIGSAFLATHPALFTATHWISAVGDPLALAFGMAMLLFAERRDRWRWLALPSFACALLSKELAVTLPIVVLLAASTRVARVSAVGAERASEVGAAERDPGATRSRVFGDPLTRTLFALAIGYVAYLAVSDAMGSRRAGTDAAYAVGFGPHVWGNALSYLGWTVNLAFPTVRGFSDARDPLVTGWALGALGVSLVGLLWARLRRHGFGAACLAYVALLLPVLPLRSHTYHYYLELPMLAAAWALAAALDALLSLRPARPTRAKVGTSRASPTAVASGALVLLLVANGTLLVRRCETAPLPLYGLLSDPVMDRASIAQRVRDGLAQARPAPGARLALWLPDGWAYPGAVVPPPGATTVPYTRRNLRIALLDGLAVRVLFPHWSEVRIVDRHERLPARWWWALCRPDGRLRVLRSYELDALLRRFGEPR